MKNEHGRNGDDLIKEQIKVLRTNITFAQSNEETNIVMITSSKPNEGKTFIASNLAQSLADSDYRVLLIDADLRKPSVHKYFNLPNNHGLSDVIGGRDQLDDTVVIESDKLSILPSGTLPPNPAELLDSNEFEELLEFLRGNYDYIIIDTPPILPVTDPLIIGSLANKSILVINSKATSKDDVFEAKQRLDKLNINIFGVVLNRLKQTRKDEGYYKY